jgi:two-component system NtrC family sensor kinase
MPRRLGLKLSLSLTIIAVLIGGISGFIHWRTDRHRILDAMVVGADQLSKSITSATWHAMLADQRSDAYEVMQTIAEKQGIDRIRIFNREGHLMFTTDGSERMSMRVGGSEFCAPCHRSPSFDPTRGVEARYRIGTSPNGHRTLNMVTPIFNEPSCSDAACHAHPESVRVVGVLDVALRLDRVEQQQAEATLHLVVLQFIQILILASVIILLTRRFVGKPIQQLMRGTRAVSEMSLDEPITIEHKTLEFEELANSFDLMRERLKAALAELSQFAEQLELKVSERTEQLKAAHQKLLHSDRLASLGQLSASVAHEINNPISGVLNLSKLVERIMQEGRVPPGREEEVRKYLSRISAETARVGRIVSDLLAFSRRSKPQRSNADLNKLVSSTVSLVSHKLKLGETRADLDLAPDLPLVPCDASQMQQVVLNLVLNAAEACQSRGNGVVRISTRRKGDDAVELTVADNGEGIAKEHLTKIFDPFFTTKAEGKGVGLGLAVLYGIVQAHDGEVEVRSKVGEGTAFVVTLPLAVEPRTEPATSSAGAGQAG